MKRRVSITARARTDIAQARLWYAEIRLELADALFDDLDLTIESIRERPESFPEVEPGIRRALCQTFPYKIYFVIRPTELRILAVYHVNRDPTRWQERA